MSLVLEKKDLGGYLELLSRRFVIYAPVYAKGCVKFSIWKEGDKVALGYESTNTPVKKALFPHSEPLFTYFDGHASTPAYDREILVFGMGLEDARAIEILDEAFLTPIEDTHYGRRRKRLHIIGYVREKRMKNSFSERLSLPKPQNLDMLITEDGDRLVLNEFSEWSSELVKNGFIKSAKAKEAVPEMEQGEPLDLERISAFLELGPDQPIWHELAKKCFACGVCSYVCPICHCFDVEDRPSLTGDHGDRRRCWDSCMLADFAKVASGGNFRRQRHERIHNWYHHKFNRAIKERGHPDCVGCGRCTTSCPAKIDIFKIIEELEAMG